jgi:hypothetical protein
MLLIATLVVGGVIIAMLCGMQYQAHLQLRSQDDSLREQIRRLAQLEVENIRLSNTVAQANLPLSEVQLAELQSLREQVSALRRQTNQVQTLRAEINRLRGVLSTVRGSIPGNADAGTPDVPAEDIFPRDSWKFAGYDTPEDTVQSLVWAVSQGDEDSYMNGLAPELRDEMASEFADGSFGDSGPQEMSDITGYRIVDRSVLPDGEVAVTVYIDGEDDIVPIVLDQTDDGWVISGNGAP